MKTQHVIFPEDGSLGRIVSAQYSEDKGDFMLLIACIDGESADKPTQFRTRPASSVRYSEDWDAREHCFDMTWPAIALGSNADETMCQYDAHMERCQMWGEPEEPKEEKPRSLQEFINEHLDEIEKVFKANFPDAKFSAPVFEDLRPTRIGSLVLKLRSSNHIYFYEVPLLDVLGV